MAWNRGVLLSPVQSVRVVGIRGGSRPPRGLSIADHLTHNSLTFLHEGIQVALENRSAASAVQVHLFASKTDLKKERTGAAIRRNITPT